MNDAKQVFYNGGEGKENEYALVYKEHEDAHVLDLLVFDADGNGQHQKSVPQREPSDYASGGGGGHTWHVNHT